MLLPAMPDVVVNNQLVVLNARIYKHQMQLLHEVARSKDIALADLLRDLLEQVLPVHTSTEETMHHRLDKLYKIVTNIYATQLAAKSEALRLDIPEGVFLIPTTDKKGTFCCQGCGEDRPNRRKHLIQVQDEQLVFGDCCYFNDRYKDIVRQLL